MKISLDPKFLVTAVITFIILVVVIVLVNKFAGSAVASVAGTVMGGIALKLFDRLDYSPTIHYEVKSSSISISQVYSALVAIFIVYGSTVFYDISKNIFRASYGENYICRPEALILLVIFDWGGVAFAGWLIGRIFSDHAMRFTAVAGFVLVVVFAVNTASGGLTDTFNRILNCLIERGLIGHEAISEKLGTLYFNFRVGAILGGITRAYLAIVMARIASRRRIKKVLDTSQTNL